MEEKSLSCRREAKSINSSVEDFPAVETVKSGDTGDSFHKGSTSSWRKLHQCQQFVLFFFLSFLRDFPVLALHIDHVARLAVHVPVKEAFLWKR